MTVDARRGLRSSAAVIAVALGIALSGCSSGQTPDPTLTSAVADAVSAGRTADLGLQQSADGRIFDTTLNALLGDMAKSLSDTARELEMHKTDGDDNARYRDDALAATRAALEAVHAAQQGSASADDDLNTALDDLGALAEQQ